MVQHELTWDLLVHPFYSLEYYFSHSSIRVKEKLLEDAVHLEKMWKNRIIELSKDPERGLIIVPPPLADEKENPVARDFVRRLNRFAKEKLADRLVSLDSSFLVHSDILSRLKVKPKGKGLAMGEYFDLCVKVESSYFTRTKGQRLRRSISRSNPSLYMRNFFDQPSLAVRHEHLKERAKRMFKPK